MRFLILLCIGIFQLGVLNVAHADGIWFREGNCQSSQCYHYFAAGKTISQAKRIMRSKEDCSLVGCSVILECRGKGWLAQVSDRAGTNYTPAYPAASGFTCGYSSKAEAKRVATQICEQRGGRFCDYVRRVGYDNGTQGFKGSPE